MTAPAPPASLLPSLDGYDWERDTVGESGCSIWQLRHPVHPPLFLKQAEGRFVADLIDEFARLEWLAGRLPVPQIHGFVRRQDEAWLLTAALPGSMAESLFDEEPRQRPEIVRALGRFLKTLHSLPVEQCPFDAQLPLRLTAARRNIDLGIVDEEDFDADQAGWSAEDVWLALRGLLPCDLDTVITHGDFSLGNLMILDGEVSGCLDLGRAGRADPYQDLAILWNCLRDYEPELSDELWASYGISTPDTQRLRLHLLLDELF